MKLTNKNKNILLIITLILIFLLIYSPHFNNPFPLHIDEWHSITEATKLKETGITKGLQSVKIGFYLFLAGISYLFNLVTVYKFLPAIWIILTAILLFHLIKSKTKNYFIALLTIIFLASIKSNANILGLWFFTGLTFSIPFIFLYLYLFSEGIQKQSKKMILWSLLIMILLLPIHSISVLFSLPILLIYSLMHKSYLKKEYKFFLLFLLVPLIGIFLYSWIMDLTLINSLKDFFSRILFKSGWGILELQNSPGEIYSPIGYLLSVVGLFYLLSKRNFKKYSIFTIWTLTTLFYILIFKLTNFSPISPYQRNVYYFALSLPFLSAVGTMHLIQLIKRKIKNKNTFKVISTVLIILILIFAFYSYYSIPKQIKLYKTINQNNYDALIFLSSQQILGKVISTPEISTAMYPVSKHPPLATLYFYGDRNILDRFFETDDCNTKNQIISENKVSYILSEKSIECNWEIIYNKKNNIIYKI